MPLLGNAVINQGKMEYPCHIDYPKGDPNVAFDVTWTMDGHPLTDVMTSKPIVNHLRGDERDAYLPAINIYSHFGQTVGYILPLPIEINNLFVRSLINSFLFCLKSKIITTDCI